MHNV